MQRNIAHEKLVTDILATFGATEKARLWRNNTGMAFRGKVPIRYGLVGSGDIGGIAIGGKLISIEVKTGKAVQTKDQKNFQRMVLSFGGIYILARSLLDVAVVFDSL